MAAPDTNRRQFLTATTAIAAVAPLAILPTDAIASPDPERGELAEAINALPLSFAVAWLAEWTKRGGSYMRHGEEWFAGWPEADHAPGYRPRADYLAKNDWLTSFSPEQQAKIILERQADFRARYEGGMRALLDLLHAVEDGPAAAKVLVLADPTRGWSIKRTEG